MGDNNRYRDFRAVAFKETLPINWVERLNNEHLTWAYILHDKDTDDDGNLKSPHYHIYFHFDGKKSIAQVSNIMYVNDIAKGFAGYSDGKKNDIVFRCDKPSAWIRYFIHIDDAEKFQYNQSDIQCFGGLDVTKYFNRSDSENEQILFDIIDYSVNNHIMFFCDILNFARFHRDDGSVYSDWFNFLSTNAYVVKEYTKSYFEKYKYIRKCEDEGTINKFLDFINDEASNEAKSQ